MSLPLYSRDLTWSFIKAAGQHQRGGYLTTHYYDCLQKCCFGVSRPLEKKANNNNNNKSAENSPVESNQEKMTEKKKTKSVKSAKPKLKKSEDKITGINLLNNLGTTPSIPVVKKTLEGMGVDVKKGYSCLISSCPRLGSNTSETEEIEKKGQLFINCLTGNTICHHCKAMGPWSEFEDKFSNTEVNAPCFSSRDANVRHLMVNNSKPLEIYGKATDVEHLLEEDLDRIRNRFHIQSIERKTLTQLGVRYQEKSDALLFPYYSVEPGTGNKELVFLKRITVNEKDNGRFIGFVERFVQSQQPFFTLFGLDEELLKRKTMVLASNEFDVLALRQQKIKAASLPEGCGTLQLEILPILEKFSRIILWFGDDPQTWQLVREIGKHLGEKRCKVIWPSESTPSPRNAIKSNINMVELIKTKSRQFEPDTVVTVGDLIGQVKASIYDQACAGIKWQRFPVLNNVLKGHRRGEMTIFTGLTGTGKTTFMSEYSLDLCMQGVPTLWGSFEISNVKLVRKMLTQFAMENIEIDEELLNKTIANFRKLPLYFMTFYGQAEIERVIETLNHAVCVHDIKHVVIDNLQFMMGIKNDDDKFARQDKIIAMLRDFATKKHCHVTVIIHPRKEREEDLSMLSVYGSGKATQEADNVILLQERKTSLTTSKKFIQIVKNRYDGEQGVMKIKFDPVTLSYMAKPKTASVALDDFEAAALSLGPGQAADNGGMVKSRNTSSRKGNKMSLKEEYLDEDEDEEVELDEEVEHNGYEDDDDVDDDKDIDKYDVEEELDAGDDGDDDDDEKVKDVDDGDETSAMERELKALLAEEEGMMDANYDSDTEDMKENYYSKNLRSDKYYQTQNVSSSY